MKSVKKFQMTVTYVSFGLLQQNNDFWTLLAQVNKMVYMLLSLDFFFTTKNAF